MPSTLCLLVNRSLQSSIGVSGGGIGGLPPFPGSLKCMVYRGFLGPNGCCAHPPGKRNWAPLDKFLSTPLSLSVPRLGSPLIQAYIYNISTIYLHIGFPMFVKLKLGLYRVINKTWHFKENYLKVIFEFLSKLQPFTDKIDNLTKNRLTQICKCKKSVRKE